MTYSVAQTSVRGNPDTFAMCNSARILAIAKLVHNLWTRGRHLPGFGKPPLRQKRRCGQVLLNMAHYSMSGNPT